MMSYLWILLLGSLLASRAQAQEEDGPADGEPAFLDDPTDEPTEVLNAATEEPQPADGLDPAADDSVAEEEGEDAVTPTASDPAEAEEPEAAEEGSEETTTDAADPADDLVEGEEETTTITADLPGDLSEEISTTAEPEPLETTTFTEEDDLPVEASGETATPTPADEEIIITTTTAPPEQEIPTTTTAPPFPVVPVEEAEQKTTTTTAAATTAAATTTTEVEEIPLVPEAPADSKEVPPTTDVSEAEETTGEVADQINEEVIKVNKGSRSFAMAPVKDAPSQDTPKGEETSSKPLAAVLSGIVVSAVGAVAAYFTYQKKKLCFKNRQADPETGNKGQKADPAEAKSNLEALDPLVDQKS